MTTPLLVCGAPGVRAAHCPAAARAIERAGLYQLLIAPEADLGSSTGSYELTARVTTAPAAEDLAYARGLALLEQYWPLLSRGTPESLDELLRVTDEAVRIWRALGDRPYEAVARYGFQEKENHGDTGKTGEDAVVSSPRALACTALSSFFLPRARACSP